jgi:septum formation protein
MKRFVLASSSPRRKELLKFIIDDFEILSLDVDETTDIVDPVKLVTMLARKKAMATFEKVGQDCVVIGADTIVVHNDMILGKPTRKADAKAMLKTLSGESHLVYTGFNILHKNQNITGVEKTKVTFSDLMDQEISDYIETGEPMDKAGAYGIQGFGSKFISKIEGCYYCVMGFPINRIYAELKKANLI